jgi:ribosomal protein S18 acetylase RimI-like enzyme
MSEPIEVRPVREDEWPLLAERLASAWGSAEIVSRGRVHDATRLPGLVGIADGQVAGLVTYDIRDGECELVTLNAFVDDRGVGSALLAAAAEEARQHGCRRLWLITTNDNLRALRFYQRRGLRLVALRANEIEKSRRLKPSIPLVGNDGIPIRDELELEQGIGGDS